MSPTTNKTTTSQEITTPVKSNVYQIPKTPSLIPHDDFNLTPNTQTTHSFADSGFFSAADGTYGAVTDYKDWILFPDIDNGVGENEFLDTSGFFRDADEIMNYSDMEDHDAPASMQSSPSSSLELPALNKSSNPTCDHELRALTESLESHYISSPPQSPRQPLQATDFTTIRRLGEDVSMLDIWQRLHDRSERIAYQFEQPPYAQRGHLLPVFRQSSRVRRRSGNGNARRSRRLAGL